MGLKTFVKFSLEAGLGEAESLSNKIRYTNFFSILFGALVLLYGLVFWIFNFKLLGLMTIPFGLSFYGCTILNSFAHYKMSRFSLVIISNLTIFTFSASFPKDAEIHIWFLIAAVFPFLIYDMKERFNLIAASVLAPIGYLVLTIFNFKFPFLVPAISLQENLHLIAASIMVGSFIVLVTIVFMISHEYEKALFSQRTGDKKIKSIIEASSAVFYTCQTSGDYAATFIGENIIDLGYTPEEFLSDPDLWRNSIHPHDVDRVLKGLGALFSNGKYCHEYRLKKKDGTYIWVQDMLSLLYDEHDRPVEIVGFLRDFTAEKETSWQLNALRETLYSSAIVSITDNKGRIVYANEALCKLSGYAENELLGQDHRILNSGIHPKKFFSEMWYSLNTGRHWRDKICNRKKDGTLYWVDSSILALRDYDGDIKQYISIRYDITEDKERQVRLIESSKMSSLGEISAGIAHEINNPLGIISNKIERILRKLNSSPVDHQALLIDAKKIEDMIQRITKIITGLKGFSRDADNDQLEAVKISNILNSTLDLCREKFEQQNVQVISRINEDVMIESRATQISQVLLNLLTNSFDSIENLSEKWIEVETVIENDFIKIQVTDSGRGIPEEIVNKIMNPFFTTKDVGKGTGLGLSISRRIINEHNGNLFYDSSSPNTRFVILLPIYQRP